ncbi:MAG: polysulfide reductase NrfD [Deltaproteobacteria bacterium]|nr:polysulfide reductase NrfD [Deltaproteobacteria bacterium]
MANTAPSTSIALPDDPNVRGDIVLEDPIEGREALVRGDRDFHYITEAVCKGNEAPLLKTPSSFVFGLLLAFAGFLLFGGYVGWLFWEGPGIWGNNNPVSWAWDIVNFVFWVGIGHAGTLISAILYLFRQKWRMGVNRYAEAMTIFAVICAASCVVLHTGRIWLDYFLFPIPNQMQLWPNFRSPLEWDVFAVNTYFTVSLLFWFTGLVPDFATLRDRATVKWRQLFYGALALGWRGSARHWVTYEKAYQILAAFSAPLVLSVHSVVSFDFAVSQLPGWHTTIFPPYFVAGAIFGGFAMVQNLIIPARAWLGLKDIITIRHIENMNKIILLTGSLVGYAYGMEFFVAAYSGNEYEGFTFINRSFGPYWWAYWIMISCNVLSPQVFWFKKLRTNVYVAWVVAALVNTGMWFERFVICVTSLHRDALPSSWEYFVPRTEVLFLAGTFGLFLFLFLLFIRFFPVIAISEVKTILPQANPHWEGYGHAKGGH